jgi:hypothetical protein
MVQFKVTLKCVEMGVQSGHTKTKTLDDVTSHRHF